MTLRTEALPGVSAPFEWREAGPVIWLQVSAGPATAAFSTRRGGVSEGPYGSLNLGMVGAFEAAKSEGDGSVLMTAKYTDKSDLAPDNYLTSVIYDFSVMLDEILTKVQDGTTGGYLGMDYDKGISLQEPANVDKAVAAQVDKAVEDLKSGAIEVKRDVTPVG